MGKVDGFIQIQRRAAGYEPVEQRLKHDHGIVSANIKNARGVGRITPLAYRGVGEQSEKEILTVAVAAARADELFEYIFRVAQIDQPHGGIMYLHGLARGTAFTLPQIPEEA